MVDLNLEMGACFIGLWTSSLRSSKIGVHRVHVHRKVGCRLHPVTRMKTGMQCLSDAEAPQWMKKKYIRSGYRPPNLSIREILLSAFRLHNETGNIWSHGVAAVAFLVHALRMIWVMMKPTSSFSSSSTAVAGLAFSGLRRLSNIDRALMVAYPLAATVTFSASTIYHLFQCRSERTYQTLRNLDFQSILVLITASYLPALSLAYGGLDVLWKVYMGLTVGALPIASLLVFISYRFGHVGIKNIVLIVSAFWGIVPTLHTQSAPGVPMSSVFVRSAVVMWALYAIGFLFYGTKLPERLFRNHQAPVDPTITGDQVPVNPDLGRSTDTPWQRKARVLDLIGNSHQLWHLFTILAAVSWMRFLNQYALAVATAASAAM
mmetsp:Transcript_9330/g.19075  ORF Transcript_9330/g.19075 Transcript_9330/m.19075 type:complete len:376 (+) Transcript_9330:156-1283(+)